MKTIRFGLYCLFIIRFVWGYFINIINNKFTNYFSVSAFIVFIIKPFRKTFYKYRIAVIRFAVTFIAIKHNVKKFFLAFGAVYVHIKRRFKLRTAFADFYGFEASCDQLAPFRPDRY